MCFLEKNCFSVILAQKWKYGANTSEIREALFVEQFGFCAYTEEFLEKPKSNPEIEHFNPLLKGTPEDNYFNWYLASRWVNGRAQKSNNKVPEIIAESSRNLAEIAQNIKFDEEEIEFYVENNDQEAKALMNFLCLNKLENLKGIKEHLDFIEDANYEIPFTTSKLFARPQVYLNYISAVAAHLQIPNLKGL